jgi:hypothetical protein
MFEEDEYDSLAVQLNANPSSVGRPPNADVPLELGADRLVRKREAPSVDRVVNTPAKRVKTAGDRMAELVSLVGRIAAAREAEIQSQRIGEQVATAVRSRNDHHKMLDDLRDRIVAIETAMISALTPVKVRLQSDLDFILEERDKVIAAIRSQSL